MPRKPKNEQAKVNPLLNDFQVRINEFGEIVSSYDVQKLNEFLDEHVEDKKFRGIEVVRRDDEES
ncbi:MAG: hypothetical protein NZ108_01070 [Bacteroidia bacterium]|nr:hypothetical protein [Bacteroidia bacterium]